MSKFKVGDILRSINFNREYVIVGIKYFYELTMWELKLLETEEIIQVGSLDDFVFVRSPQEKTPHQELLDLGWELSKDDNRYIEYINEEGDYLIIDKIEKTYYNLSSYYRPFDINLQLAKILVRYLEELE